MGLRPAPSSSVRSFKPTSYAKNLSARFQIGHSPALMVFVSSLRCQKCYGLVIVEQQDLGSPPEIRCVNCGCRPQHHDRITTESEASRSIRQATRELLEDNVFKYREARGR